MQYTTYIERNGVELEVVGELEFPGEGYWTTWEDTGTTFEIEKDPSFCDIYAEYPDGTIVTEFSQKEHEIIEEKLIEKYWKEENNL